MPDQAEKIRNIVYWDCYLLVYLYKDDIFCIMKCKIQSREIFCFIKLKFMSVFQFDRTQQYVLLHVLVILWLKETFIPIFNSYFLMPCEDDFWLEYIIILCCWLLSLLFSYCIEDCFVIRILDGCQDLRGVFKSFGDQKLFLWIINTSPYFYLIQLRYGYA